MKLTVYSMLGCSQCVSACNFLSNQGIPYEKVMLESSTEAWELMKKDNRRSMPQIYLNGSLFVEGGFQGLSKMSKEEIIKKMEG